MSNKRSHQSINSDLVEKEPDLSKTQAKKMMSELQDLGVSLTKLPVEILNKLELPELLLKSIKEAQLIKANGALRRQCQYIGKLMRDVDAAKIKAKLDYALGNSRLNTKILHQSEQWRDKLIASDSDLDLFSTYYPSADIVELGALVLAVRRELECGKNLNYRKLFRLIREVIEKGEGL